MKTKSTVLPSWIPLLVASLCMASGGSANAQVPAAAASCDADEQCNRLANQALDYSQADRFDDAQRAYQAAYAKQPDAKLLFNLARVLHKAGRRAEAVTYYQRYLDAGAEGNEAQRHRAQQRLDEARREQTLAAAAVKRTQTPAQSITTTPQSASSVPLESSRSVPLYRKWWLWTAVGVAAAGVAIGIGLGVAALRPDLTGYSDARPFGS